MNKLSNQNIFIYSLILLPVATLVVDLLYFKLTGIYFSTWKFSIVVLATIFFIHFILHPIEGVC